MLILVICNYLPVAFFFFFYLNKLLEKFIGNVAKHLAKVYIELMGPIYHCPYMGIFIGHRKHKSLQYGFNYQHYLTPYSHMYKEN